MKSAMAITASCLAALALTLGSPHRAQAADVAQGNCARKDAALPAPFAAWAQTSVGMSAANTPGNLVHANVAMGKKFRVALAPSSAATMATEPEKNLVSNDPHVGLLKMHVPADGRYTVMLGSNAWIDVIVDGKPVQSVAFGDNPKCSTIRKFVVFALKAGDATLQLSGASGADIDVLVSREP